MLTMTKAVPVNRGGVASGLFMIDARGDNAAPFQGYNQSNATLFRQRKSHEADAGSAAPRFHRNMTRWGDDRHVPIPFQRGISCRGDALGSGATMIAAIVSPTG
jgi:hypothetical protein